MTYLKNFTKILAAVVAIFAFNNILNAQTIGGGTYMIGDFVEVGINNDRGMEGAPSLAGSNNRSNQPITSPVYFGFVANPQMDGWVNYDGDFFTPGSPESGFGLEIAGTNYSNNAASTYWNQIPGALTSYDEIGDCIIVTWEGSVAGVDIKITYKLVKTNVFYTTTVRLVNTTAASMTDVYYYRNFDPDNNVTIGGGYATQNTVVAQPAPGCEKAYVTAEQTTPWDSYVGMGGLDANMRVTYGGFGNRDASNIWNGIGLTSAVASTTFSDQAISLAYKAATFPAGDTVEFTFAIVMDEASYDLAMSNLYSFSFEGATSTDECIPVVDTAWTCAGQPVTIDVVGPDVAGYSWSWSPGTDLSTTTGPTTDASPSTTTTYTVTGTPLSCLSTPLLKDIVVDILPAPDVSIVDPGPQCDNFDLSTLVVNDLNAVPGTVTNFYSVIPDSSDQVAGLLPDLIMEPGDVVYAMIGVPPDGCFDYEPVTITWDTHPTAGLDNASSDCSGAGSIDLNAMLSGADAGGTWEETTSPLGGGLDAAGGTYDISTVSPGDYTIDYIVGSPLGACPNDTATMTLTVEEEVTAGADNSSTICNSAGTTLDMNTLLSGADAGGTWSETSTTPSGSFDTPTGVLDASGLAGGTYTFDYTVPAVAPCLTDVATMTITINEEQDAGADNTTTICNAPGSTLDLNTLVSGDAGGIWSETTSPTSGSFTPASGMFDASGLTAGDYTFNYFLAAVAPCPSDDADFTVTVSELPTAGADNTSTVCNDAGSSIDLNTLLSGADAGGTWAEVTTSGSFDATTGVFTSDGVTAGVYTFTYDVPAVGPCPGDQATFDITVNQEANAGADNTATLCNTAGSTIDLNTLVTGDAGGSWVETTASGSFNATTGVLDASGLAADVYTFEYTVNGVAPCPDDMASFDITVTDLPDAGPDNSSSLCNTSGTTLDLNTLLAGDPGGTWSETSASPSGSFTATTGELDASGVTAGTYTFVYDIPAAGPCPGDQATITIDIEQEAVAGDDNTADLCNSAGTTLDLNTLLSADAAAGGTWSETGPASGGFTASSGMLDASGVAAGDYTFDYTVDAVAPCVPDDATFTITIQNEVNAGDDATVQECNYDGSTVDLNTLLSGADAGGTWSETTSSGAFDASSGILDLTGLAGGTYDFTYSLDAIAPCPSDEANFTVTVDEVPTLTTLTDEEMCDGDSHTAQVFGSDVPGTSFDWTNTTGTDIGFGLSGTGNIGGYTGASASSSDELVTVEVIPTSPEGCEGDAETFDVVVHPLPVVSFSADEVIGCEPLQVVFSSGGSGATCEWTFGNGATSSSCGTVSNTYDYAGTYDVGLTITTIHGCEASESYSEYITVTPEAVAQFSYSPTQITIDDPTVEFTNSSIDADGYEWTFGDGTAGSGEENPTHEYPEMGDKSYTVTLVAQSAGGCPDTTSKVIKIEDIILFFIPNVFTPDGDDYNEVFKPVMTAGYDIYDYHFTIFNRWGEIVFESYNAQYGWDGTYGSRGLVEDGTYIWQLQFGETMSDKKHTHRGHVTILK